MKISVPDEGGVGRLWGAPAAWRRAGRPVPLLPAALALGRALGLYGMFDRGNPCCNWAILGLDVIGGRWRYATDVSPLPKGELGNN